jgi:hypothetical protein
MSHRQAGRQADKRGVTLTPGTVSGTARVRRARDGSWLACFLPKQGTKKEREGAHRPPRARTSPTRRCSLERVLYCTPEM